MVLKKMNKGMFFTLDLAFALLVYSMIIFYVLSMVSIVQDNGLVDFKETKKIVMLLDASEVILTNPNVTDGGLVKYEENTAKHHELDLDKFETFVNNFQKIKERLLLSDDVFVRITNTKGNLLLEAGKPINGTKISRIALCGDESCVVEIIAK